MKRRALKSISFMALVPLLFSCVTEGSSSQTGTSAKSSVEGLQYQNDSQYHWVIDENGDYSHTGFHQFVFTSRTEPTKETQVGEEIYSCSVCGYQKKTALDYPGVMMNSETSAKEVIDEIKDGTYSYVVDWQPRYNDEDWLGARMQSNRLTLRKKTASYWIDFVAPYEGYNTSIDFKFYEEDGRTYVVRSQKHDYDRDSKDWSFHSLKVSEQYYYEASLKEVVNAYTRYDEITPNIFNDENDRLGLANTTFNGYLKGYDGLLNRVRTNLVLQGTTLSFAVSTSGNLPQNISMFGVEKGTVSISEVGVNKELSFGENVYSLKSTSTLKTLPMEGPAFNLF